MSLQIVENLPEGYIAEPTASSGSRLEVDVAAYEQQNWLAQGARTSKSPGEVGLRLPC